MTREEDVGEVPTLVELREVTLAVAQCARPVAQATLLGQALAEHDELDDALGLGVVQNPVRFAHEVSGLYVQAAGSQIYAAAHLTTLDSCLPLSVAALCRGALEFASRGWWLQDPGLSGTARVARAVAVMREDLNHPGNAGQYGVPGDELVREIETWCEAQSFKVPRGLGGANKILEAVMPGVGPQQYRHLSGLEHGRLTPLLRTHWQLLNAPLEAYFDIWTMLHWAAEATCRTLVAMAELRGQQADDLESLAALLQAYRRSFDAGASKAGLAPLGS